MTDAANNPTASAAPATTYFHRTMGGSRIRGGADGIPNYSGHGSTKRNFTIRRPAEAAEADTSQGERAKENDVEGIFAVDPVPNTDPDAGLPEGERSYGDFASFLDFWKLLDFLDALKSEPAKGETADGPVDGAVELERMMKETEGTEDKGAMANFLDVLMGRTSGSGVEAGKGDAEFHEFLKTPDSMSTKSEPVEKEWSELVKGMAPKSRQIPKEVMQRAYWKIISDPDYVPPKPKVRPEGVFGTLRWYLGFGADDGSAGNVAEGKEGREVPRAVRVEIATGVKSEGESDTVASNP